MSAYTTTYTTRPTDQEAAMYGCDPAVFETVWIAESDRSPAVAVAACTFEAVIGVFVAAGCNRAALAEASAAMRKIGHHSDSTAAALYGFMHYYHTVTPTV